MSVESAAEDGKRKLRVLIVTQYFWPENFQINHIVRAIAQRGHSVTVLTGKPNYPGGRFFDGYSMFGRGRDEFEGIAVVRSPLLPRGNGRSLRLALNYLSFVVFGTITAKRTLRQRFDVIFVYAPSPITTALVALGIKRRMGTPVLLWIQDLWPESVTAAGKIRARPVLAVLDRLVRYIYSRCDYLLIQSQAFTENIVSRGVAVERVLYFPQSVDSLFRPLPIEAAASEASLMPQGFRVVFAGSIGQAQDFETVVEAADRLRDIPDIQWVIIGSGRRQQWLAEEIVRRKLSKQFHLLGRFPEDAMPRFFAHADALLVTLRSELIFALTIPTKVQAYLASGKPIVAGLDGEGARIVNEAAAGITAPAGDPDRLAQAVLTLYRASPEERAKMGTNALAYSQRFFDRETLVDELITIMRQAAFAVRCR